MPRADIFDIDVALDTEPALSSWNAMQLAFLAHGASTPDHLAALFDAAPDFVRGHAAHGLFMLLLGRRELFAVARDDWARADRLRAGGGTTAHDAVYVDALGDWLAGHPARAADRLDGLTLGPSPDALAAKLVQAIRFVLGDVQGMRASIERVVPRFPDCHPAAGYLHGCLAFALEETGDYAGAEAAGRHALDLAPDDAWGLHAVAHVYDMTGRADRGVDWLTERRGAWGHCNNFRYHVWWHLALFHLDQGAYDRVLDLYDREIRSDCTDDYRDIANAASLLTRLELDGVDVGGRWRELANIAEHRTEDGCVVFADLHYMLALLADDRTEAANTLVARMICDAARGQSDMERVAACPGLAAAHGLTAFRAGRYDLAFANLSQARITLQSIGGSHAQRDVFQRLAIEAGLRAGRFDQARTLIDDRTRSRGAVDGFARSRLDLLRQAKERGPRDRGAVRRQAVPVPF
ncbi:MAG: tetratricopeptide repeat protein [Inquilinaceae bacterium]